MNVYCRSVSLVWFRVSHSCKLAFHILYVSSWNVQTPGKGTTPNVKLRHKWAKCDTPFTRHAAILIPFTAHC